MTAPRVAICVPIYDTLEPDFWTSLNRLWKPRSGSPYYPEGGTSRLLERRGMTIEEARRTLVAECLATPDVTHALFADADMTFAEHSLQRLLSHEKPIVGGLCHNRRTPYQPILGKKHADADRGYGWVYHYPPDTLYEVDITGAAFLLIQIDVFREIEKKFGEHTSFQLIRGKSEDFSFCERARACGYSILVDTGLEIGHIGKVVIDAAFAKRNRPFEHESWIPDPGVPVGKPVASIIIPTYNQNPRWLKAAVLSASHQTVPVEVIVIDDGSNPPVPRDGWPENVRIVRHARGSRLSYPSIALGEEIPPANWGIAHALNSGIEEMTTDWFAWLSSDDLLDPRKIEMQLHATKQAGCKASFHRYQVIGETHEEWAKIAQVPVWGTIEAQQRILAAGCAINGSTVLIHRSVFGDTGPFDPEFRYGQDWEMWCRIGQKHFWFCLDEILGTRREVTSNLTQTIAVLPEKQAIRDREDALIRERYTPKEK